MAVAHLSSNGKAMHAYVSVCLCVGHNSEPYQNGRTDRGAVWSINSDGSNELCVRWGPGSRRGRSNFVDINRPVVSIAIIRRAVNILNFIR